MLSILKEKLKTIVEKIIFFTSIFLLSLVTEFLIYTLNRTSMSQFYPIYTSVDPDSYSECGSASTKLLNTVRIQYGSGSTTLDFKQLNKQVFFKSIFFRHPFFQQPDILVLNQYFSCNRSEKWSVWGLENGLSTLVETLQEHLTTSGVEIFTQYNITSLDFR